MPLWALSLFLCLATVASDHCRCRPTIYTDPACTQAFENRPNIRLMEEQCINDPENGFSWKVGSGCTPQLFASEDCSGNPVAAQGTTQCRRAFTRGTTTYYAALACSEPTCAPADLETARSCWSKYLVTFAIRDPSCQRLQNMANCYVRDGCGDQVQSACAFAKDCQLKCEPSGFYVQAIGSGPARSFLIINKEKFALLDFGGDAAEAQARVQRINSLIASGKMFVGGLLTSGTPGKAQGAYLLKQNFPNVPLLAATEALKSEMIHNLFQSNLQANNLPFNPRNFDYTGKIEVMKTMYDLFGWDVRIILDKFEVGQTRHFSLINIPSIDAWIVGDVAYSNEIPVLTGAADLQVTCDMISTLKRLKNKVNENTLLYTSSGPSGSFSPKTAPEVIQSNIDYIEAAREIFIKSCDPNTAATALRQDARFSQLSKQERIQEAAEALVPSIAKSLNENCCTTNASGQLQIGPCATISPPICV